MEKHKESKRSAYFPYIIAIFASLFFLMSLVVATRYMNKSHEVSPENSYEQKGGLNATETPPNSLPEEFPNDFPIYDDSKLTDSWATKSKDINGMSLVWKTEDKPQAVFDFFQKSLSDENYDYKVISQEPSSYTVSFEKGEISGFVGITEAEGQTAISVTMGIKQGSDTPVEE